MAALFTRRSNTIFGIALAAIAFVILAVVVAPMIYIRTPYASGRFDPIEQPVQFDHRHHARDDAIDCFYCHPGAEKSGVAGIPPTELCMGCHGQIWTDSPQLEPVRQSWASGTAIPWVRVHDLPDHVYFHHGVHTQGGIPCSECHGKVENMTRVYRVQDLTMGFCIDCHRNPPGPRNFGRQLTPLTTCSACHR